MDTVIELNISKKELTEIDFFRFNHPSAIVQKRMHIIFLKELKFNHTMIGQALNVHVNTVTKILKMYNAGGIEKLKEINYGTNKSELEAHKVSIEDSFKIDPVSSIKEAQNRIEKLTGIKRSNTQVRKFLIKLGMKYRKMGYVPSKADPEKQKDYLKKNSSH
jgi:transposase